jgi:hypothetical protein
MGALTDAQMARLQAAPPAPEPPVETYDSWFKYEDPTTMSAGMMNSLKMLGNIPYSTLKLAEASYHAGTDLTGVGRILLKGISGSGEVLFQELGLQDFDTENSELARSFGRFYIDRIKNPGRTLVEDPMGALLDVSPGFGLAAKGIGAGIRATGVGARTGAGANVLASGISGLSINPLTQGLPAAGRAANWTARQGRRGLAGLSSLASMKAPRNYGKVYRGAEQGRFTETAQYLNERASAEGMVRTFRNAVGDLAEQRRLDYQPKLQKLKAKSPYMKMDKDLLQVKKDLVKSLVDGEDIVATYQSDGKIVLNFENSRIDNPPVQRRINRLLGKLERWTDSSPHGLDKLKQAIDSFRETDGKRFKLSNHYNDEVRKNIRQHLSKIDGYDDMVGPFEESIKLHKQLDKVLAAGSDNPELIINKLTTMMGESAGKEIRRGIVERLERKTGIPISEQVAGLELSEWMGKGLFGHGLIWSGLGAFGEINADTARWMAYVPLTSPRLAGNLFLALGASKSGVKGITKFVQDIHDRLPPGVGPGMTMLQAIEHIDQHEQLRNASGGGFVPVRDLTKMTPAGSEFGIADSTALPSLQPGMAGPLHGTRATVRGPSRQIGPGGDVQLGQGIR